MIPMQTREIFFRRSVVDKDKITNSTGEKMSKCMEYFFCHGDGMGRMLSGVRIYFIHSGELVVVESNS